MSHTRRHNVTLNTRYLLLLCKKLSSSGSNEIESYRCAAVVLLFLCNTNATRVGRFLVTTFEMPGIHSFYMDHSIAENFNDKFM